MGPGIGSQHPWPNAKPFETSSSKLGQKLSHHVMPSVLVLKAQGRHVVWSFWASFGANFGQKRSHHVMDASCWGEKRKGGKGKGGKGEGQAGEVAKGEGEGGRASGGGGEREGGVYRLLYCLLFCTAWTTGSIQPLYTSCGSAHYLLKVLPNPGGVNPGGPISENGDFLSKSHSNFCPDMPPKFSHWRRSQTKNQIKLH